MKKGTNQVEKNDSQTELGKQMQALTLKIETLMRSQAQVPITTPSFPTYDRCGIMHGPRKCIVDDKLVAAMDEINFVGEKKILTINTPTISIKDKASGKVKGCIDIKPYKIRGLDKRRVNLLFKRPCFNIWLRMIRE